MASSVVFQLMIICTIGIFANPCNIVAADSNNEVMKDARCHSPFVNRITGALIPKFAYAARKKPSDVFELIAWFYDDNYKSCIPLYSVGGLIYHDENTDLPKSKAECEDLCADPCKLDNGMDGICMTEEYCQIKSEVFAGPCHVKYINCCLREISSRPLTTI